MTRVRANLRRQGREGGESCAPDSVAAGGIRLDPPVMKRGINQRCHRYVECIVCGQFSQYQDGPFSNPVPPRILRSRHDWCADLHRKPGPNRWGRAPIQSPGPGTSSRHMSPDRAGDLLNASPVNSVILHSAPGLNGDEAGTLQLAEVT